MGQLRGRRPVHLPYLPLTRKSMVPRYRVGDSCGTTAMITNLINAVTQRISQIDFVVLGLMLGTTLVGALIVYWRTAENKSFADFFEFALPKEVILHPSARADAL